MNPAMAAYLKAPSSLPSAQHIVWELIRMLDAPESSAHQVAACISHDQALTARVLGLANSSFYGLSSRIGTVQDAMLVLGMQHVRRLAISVSLSQVAVHRPELQAFWAHSLRIAWNAEWLAGKLACHRDTCFIAGLLHDVGLLLMYDEQAERFTQWVHSQRDGCELLQAERDELGFDHAELGAELGRLWHFPEAIIQAIASHHIDAAMRVGPVATIVYSADELVHVLQQGRADPDTPCLPDPILRFLGLDQALWQAWLDQQADISQRVTSTLGEAD